MIPASAIRSRPRAGEPPGPGSAMASRPSMPATARRRLLAEVALVALDELLDRSSGAAAGPGLRGRRPPRRCPSGRRPPTRARRAAREEGPPGTRRPRPSDRGRPSRASRPGSAWCDRRLAGRERDRRALRTVRHDDDRHARLDLLGRPARLLSQDPHLVVVHDEDRGAVEPARRDPPPSAAPPAGSGRRETGSAPRGTRSRTAPSPAGRWARSRRERSPAGSRSRDREVPRPGHRARVEGGDLVLVEVGRDEERRRVDVVADPQSRDTSTPSRSEPLPVLGGVGPGRREEQRPLAEQREPVGDVRRAAALRPAASRRRGRRRRGGTAGPGSGARRTAPETSSGSRTRPSR